MIMIMIMIGYSPTVLAVVLRVAITFYTFELVLEEGNTICPFESLIYV